MQLYPQITTKSESLKWDLIIIIRKLLVIIEFVRFWNALAHDGGGGGQRQTDQKRKSTKKL